jgi:hypothetical protein
MVLRKMFGFKRDEVIGEWRRIHDKELHYLYCTTNIVQKMKNGKIGGERSKCGGVERCI